jgi:hypothetical protein
MGIRTPDLLHAMKSLASSPTRPYAAGTGHTLAHASCDWLRQALPGGILPLKVPLQMITSAQPDHIDVEY